MRKTRKPSIVRARNPIAKALLANRLQPGQPTAGDFRHKTIAVKTIYNRNRSKRENPFV